MSSISSDQISVVSSNPSTDGMSMTSPETTFTSNEIESAEEIHPRLEELRELARERATAIHTEQKAKKALRLKQQPQTNKITINKKPKKQLTKRQLSSKKSAEICRIKSGIYTELLERAVCEVEKEFEQMNNELSKLFIENMNYNNRIYEIENQKIEQQQLKFKQEEEEEEEEYKYQPGLSNDFHFDENDQNIIDMSLVLPIPITSNNNNNRKFDSCNNSSSNFINEVMLTHPIEQSSSPMTEISYDPNLFDSQKLSESVFPIR